MQVQPVPEESVSLLESTPKRRKGGCIPLHAFVMITISVLILSGCLLVWLSSFIVSSYSIQNLNTNLIDESAQKISRTLEGFLSPVGKITRMMARDWNKGVVTVSNMRDYLHPIIVEFGFTSAGFFFNDTYSYRYAFSVQGTVSSLFWVYVRQDYGQVISYRDKVNITTGDVIVPNFIKVVPQVVNTFDYWLFMVNYTRDTGSEGAFGDPSFAAGSGFALTYTQWVYDQFLWKNQTKKRFIGLAKINLSLDYIVQYLSSNIDLIGDGYVVVTLNSGIVIGGSINTTVNDGTTVANIFDIETRKAGKTIKKFYEMNGNTFKNFSSKSLTVESEGVKYIVSPFKFRYENLEWNIFFVLYESDVNAPMVMSSSISVGMTVLIIIVGLVASLLTGWLVASPMRFLEKQFEFIRVMKLENVNMTKSSPFREFHSIYGNLNDTVMWLNEIKAFIPEHVFAQLNQSEEISLPPPKETKKHAKKETEFEDMNARQSRSNLGSSQVLSSGSAVSHLARNSSFKSPSIFKTGYLKKGCAFVHVKLEGLSNKDTNFISSFFEKFMSSVGPIIKVQQANIQFITCDEFEFSITSKYVEGKLLEKTIECCNKIVKTIDPNDRIQARIGICCGMAEVGNIGTKTARFYSVHGDVPNCARYYSDLACQYNVNMITDDKNLPLDNFITRPLDRIQIPSNVVLTIYQIIAKKNQENDEWLYELENNKLNDKYNEYSNIFKLFSISDDNYDVAPLINSAKEILDQYKLKGLDESDLSFSNLRNLLHVLSQSPKQEALSILQSYSNTLVKEMKSNKL
ncbi:predicted protein [Naegleria gruberi]|uniref:Predicted protein n=1 Tax=Naegleria gruberi TaxID=5762 RepID=D2V9K9_NAEGR|nr:uncharacterized protein NAEGRDRAFT_65477 [Naegleria gruberi]EFC46480.1 predicted protein [Naegleria gruberi]|eukprot:XP_002679224.1 predicted protein [Naegleria gruberi strain NEG-M]